MEVALSVCVCMCVCVCVCVCVQVMKCLRSCTGYIVFSILLPELQMPYEYGEMFVWA